MLAIKSWWSADGYHYTQYYSRHRKCFVTQNMKIKNVKPLLTKCKNKTKTMDLSST